MKPTTKPTPALVPVNRGKRLSAPVYTTNSAPDLLAALQASLDACKSTTTTKKV